MLTIRCPSCSKAHRLAPEHLGKSVRCQSCSQVFVAQSDVAASTPQSFMDDGYLSGSLPASPVNAPIGNATSTSNAAPRSYQSPAGKRGTSDQIDYCIHGDDTQYVEVTLDPGETVIAEAGSMMYMTPGIEMQTVFGDPSSSGGFWNKVVSAGKRVLTGESLFMTTFTNLRSQGREHIAFRSEERRVGKEC